MNDFGAPSAIRNSVGPSEHVASIRSLYGTRPDLMAHVVADLGIYAFSNTARSRIRDFGADTRTMATAAAELGDRLLSSAGIARLDELNRELESMRIATGMTREQIAQNPRCLGIGGERSIYTVERVREENRIPAAETDTYWRNVAAAMKEIRGKNILEQERLHMDTFEIRFANLDGSSRLVTRRDTENEARQFIDEVSHSNNRDRYSISHAGHEMPSKPAAPAVIGERVPTHSRSARMAR